METSEIIEKAIKGIMSTTGYCGSCIGGCSIYVRFICLGYNSETINKYVNDHPSEFK